MNTTSTNQPLPSLQQMVAIAALQVKRTLRTMEEIASKEVDYEIDASVDCALQAVLNTIDAMESSAPKDVATFSKHWDIVISIVDLANRAFSHKGCYKNLLVSLEREVIALNYTVELAAEALP